MEKRILNILFFISLPRFIKYKLLNSLKVDRQKNSNENSSKFILVFCLNKEENFSF